MATLSQNVIELEKQKKTKEIKKKALTTPKKLTQGSDDSAELEEEGEEELSEEETESQKQHRLIEKQRKDQISILKVFSTTVMPDEDKLRLRQEAQRLELD